MNIIIPMAGKGKRLRPHTLSVPKPLIKIAGKSIVERLVEQVTKSIKIPISTIGYIISEKNEKVEKELTNVSTKYGANTKFYIQKSALGTAHAIDCASELLEGKVIIAYADTLFKAKFEIDDSDEGIIWVKKVKDPSMFGVVKVNKEFIITGFIEKPKEKIYDKAIIGIYYFKNAEKLRNEIKVLINNNLMVNGEYQLTDSLEGLRNKRMKILAKEVDKWMDCGNKDATVKTNIEILKVNGNSSKIKDNNFSNTVLIKPVYIGENVEISDSIIGPFVSIEDGTIITNSIIKNSIIQSGTKIYGEFITNSMIGNNANIIKQLKEYSIGDYSRIEY